MRVFRLAAAIAAILTVLSACAKVSHGEAPQAHVLRYADELDVTTLSPLLATSSNISWLAQLTLAFLTRTDAHARPTPELATVVPSIANGGISKDGRTITWHLRQNVRWSDGKPFDADDVVFSVRVIQDPSNSIPTREGWDNVARVDEPDKHTVVFHLKTPYAAFFERYFGSDGNAFIMPKHILGSSTNINKVAYNALPVGIGPFRYTAFHRGDSVVMEANPYYFRGRPKLDRIVYKIIPDDNTLFTQLQTGELDLWVAVNGAFYDRVKTIAGKTVTSIPSPFTSAIFFNVSRPPLRDPAVRRALRLATDRTQLFDKVFHHSGLLVESVVPTVTQDYDPSLRQGAQDLAQANAVLDAAGWKRGPDGIRTKNHVKLNLELVLPTGYQPSATAAELIRESWAKVGVGVQTHAYGTAQYFAPYNAGGILNVGKWDVSLLSQSSDPIATILDSFGCPFAPPNGQNLMRYCNPAVDALVTKYGQTYDDAMRRPIAYRFQQMIDHDAPEIVNYERAFIFAYDARLRNFHPKPFGMFDDFMNVDI